MTPAGARPVVLFDAGGTLTDSDYLHVHAWYRAFSEAGVDVLARDDLVSALTSSQDVDTAKPQPDIVQVALERAGVPTIAVLSGGVSRGELETAGAQAVFENASDLCAHLSRHRDRTACEGGPDRLIIPAVARTASPPTTRGTG